jgi:hypothetical protein
MSSIQFITNGEQMVAQFTAYQPVTVRLIDGFGAGIPSVTVRMECPAGRGTFPDGFANSFVGTDAGGYATFPGIVASGALGLFEPIVSAAGTDFYYAQFTTIDAGVAFWLATVAGANQAAPVNTAFANPVVVRVTNQIDGPVPGWPVKFTAQVDPGTGASAVWTGFANPVTVNADGAGYATTPPFSANGFAGTYWIYAEANALTWQMIYENNGPGVPPAVTLWNALAPCEV